MLIYGKKLMKEYSKIFGRLGNNLFQGAYIYAKFLDGEIPDIYLQDPIYFDHHREELRKLYGTPTETIDYVAIHVRRGDYVNNHFYVNLWETDYYEKAMSLFPNEKFLIFSDDPDWCEENFIGDEYSVSYGTELEDFNLMSSCKAIITANSSFSWWAAYLSNCGKVVAPSVENWYTDNIERTKCPESWIRI